MKNIANKIPNSRFGQRTDERRFPPKEKQYRGYSVEVPGRRRDQGISQDQEDDER